ncbi:condensation domain-containing protein (plasmid) [Streptomyces sp. FXJ1.172]|uniref:condensation domain-containing protein n=1 Tax=Streptomyces sp. FXJ1.172 TaxID=710705 RepID=UPI0023DD34B9|nr:condensation domain-containing protein [Streptomyces sp. FXJ1.172]WEP00992.1 condensation domain-containing protein [Streptomyces sp. FXJ1.172]
MHRSITGTYLKHYANVRDGADELMPLTGAQRRFHHTRSADPHDRVRILPVFVEFPPGLLSAHRLEQAARSVLLRHPALRGTADTAGGVPVLRIGPLPADPVVREIVASDDGAVWAALDDWPAGRGSFRVLLARDEKRDLLAIGFDHLVCDGESTGLVLDALVSGYQSGERVPDSVAAAELRRYREAVEQQLTREHEASGPEALAHWTSRVRDAGPGLWSRNAGEAGGQASAWQRVALPDSATDRPFPVLLAACHTALTRIPGTAPVAYTWGGHDEAGVVGCFINTVLANPQGEGVRESWWEDLEFVDTPFDEVVRAARASHAPWTGHLDLVLTLIDRTRRPAPVLDGVPGRFRYPPGNSIEEPVIVTAVHDQGELSLRIDHDPTIVPGAAAAGIAGVLRESLVDAGHAEG